MYIGAHSNPGRHHDARHVLHVLRRSWRLLVAPVFQIVAIGTQLTEAMAGLERTREILNEKAEDEDAGRTANIDRINGRRGI